MVTLLTDGIVTGLPVAGGSDARATARPGGQRGCRYQVKQEAGVGGQTGE